MDDIRTEVVTGKYTDDENSDALSEYQGIILWPRRSYLYRISFHFLMPLYVIFLLGFSSPFWMKRLQVDKHRGYYNKVDKVDVSIGLWRVCEGSDFSNIMDCTSLPDSTSYEMACQAMMCLSLIFSSFSILFGLYENCATIYDTEDGSESKTKWPEMNAIAAGIFGLIGVGMYGVIIIEIAREGSGSVHWAFPVTTVTVTGFIVCGILMAISNPIQAQTQNYPGQIMRLPRQNSLRLREPSIQDRLVVMNDSSGQQSGTQTPSTLYGMAGSNAEVKESQVFPRSESCLSAHMSSPDLFTASSQPLAPSNGQRGTHVVETHDAYVSTYDAARRQAVKQQIQNKAAQRRSWHFDDRSGAYIVSDLINTRPTVRSPVDSSGEIEKEVVKPPVPPRKDKMAPQPNPNRLAKNSTLQAIPDENVDLMVLDDPVVMAPNATELDQPSMKPVVQKNADSAKSTNPFINDIPEDQSDQASILTAGQEEFIRQDSWENQPWPDPPSEKEILEHIQSAQLTSNAASSTAQSNSVPESLQYQPQNQASLTRKQGRALSSKCPASDGGDGVPAKVPPRMRPSERQNKRKTNAKPAPVPDSHVPVLKEYDNPLFKSSTPEDRRSNHFSEEFSMKLCDSTSFVNPSPQSPPPYYTVVDNAQADLTSHRRHSSHYSYSPQLDNRENVQLSKRPVSLENGQDFPPRNGNKPYVDTAKKRPKAKPKSSSQQNGAVKSRPRQVKREHNQRKTGHPEGANTLQHQKAQSPHGGPYYGSSPDLVNKSPKTGRRDLTNNLPTNGSCYDEKPRGPGSRSYTPTNYRTSPYAFDSNRQSPYYASGPVNQYHWADSDL
ncbi:uncharacterized protein LOC106068526 [Biomphalaria glabrata]|uniref:Uncharacterized protein LOC106068526 n=1 Tax=Biomphalaria glabrata TaxID=6526 RepID=A0A9W2YC66_BIOGL|nr:uncharacterized protein LOC106068526 [Biomphalaria glabrata]